MLQQLIVTIAVLAAALYCAWALAPARSRSRLLARLDAALARREAAAGTAAGPGLLRTRVLAPLLRRATPGCGSCAADPAAPPAAQPPQGSRRP